VGIARDILEAELSMRCSFTDKTGNSLRDDAPFLGTCAALDKHLQIQPLRRQTLQCILTNGTEMTFVNVLEQSVLQVNIA
jgi:hypothetical protein